jgi:hypothetical protein
MQHLVMTNLQNSILKYIILNESVDYQIISKKVKRDRTTIIQSMKSLTKKKFVNYEKYNPKHKKSKIFFRPTVKGVIYGIGYLNIKLNEIKNRPLNLDDLNVYETYVKNLSEQELWNHLAIMISRSLINNNMFDNEGSLNVSEPYELSKKLFKSHLLNDLLDNKFDIENLFTPKTEGIDLIKDIAKPEGLMPLKKILIKLKNNIQQTIDMISQ